MKTATGAIAALLVAAGALATAAQADVAVTIGSDGYSDFLKRCNLDVEVQTSGGIDEAWVFYRVAAGDKGARMCTRDATGAGCNGELAAHTCEDLSGIDVYDVSCLAADGSSTECGAVTISAGDGLTIPVAAVPAPPPADLTVFGTVSGFDDTAGRCDLGFMYAGPPEVRYVKLKVEVPHAGGTGSCSFGFGRTGGSGSSCKGEDEFTCDAVNQIVVKEVACTDGSNDVDCGTVGFSAAEEGLMVDGR